MTERKEATKRLPTGKWPGPDGVLKEILRVFAKKDLEALLSLFNTCLDKQKFLEIWEKVRLGLVPQQAYHGLEEFQAIMSFE